MILVLNANRLAGCAAFKAHDRNANVDVLAVEQQVHQSLRLGQRTAARGALRAIEYLALMAAVCPVTCWLDPNADEKGQAFVALDALHARQKPLAADLFNGAQLERRGRRGGHNFGQET